MTDENATPEWVAENLSEGLRDIPFLKDAPDVETFKTRLTAAAEHVGNSMRIPGPDAGKEDWDAFDQKLTEKIPGLSRFDFDSEEARVDIMRKLGMPEKADEYGAEGDSAWLAEVALAAGLTKAQFEGLVKGVTDKNISRNEEMTAEQVQAVEALKQEWGLSAPKKMEHILGLAKLTDAPEAMVNMLAEGKADAATLKWMDNIAGQFAEVAKFASDRNDPEALTPQEASMQIQEILKNPDYFSQTAIGSQLRAKMLELQKAANPQAKANSPVPAIDPDILANFG